jgi:hypothetical protein
MVKRTKILHFTYIQIIHLLLTSQSRDSHHLYVQDSTSLSTIILQIGCATTDLHDALKPDLMLYSSCASLPCTNPAFMPE